MDPPKPPSKHPSPSPSAQPPRKGSLTSFSIPRTSTSDLNKPPKSPTPSSSKDRLLSSVSKMTSWLSTSEPSAQALKQHKKDAFARAGIPLVGKKPDAAQVHAKLHAPIGEIPQDAIRPAGGLTPEEAARRKAAERRQKMMMQDVPYAGGGRGRGGGSSSGLSSGGSTSGGSVLGRGAPPGACPWEEVVLEEWDK